MPIAQVAIKNQYGRQGIRKIGKRHEKALRKEDIQMINKYEKWLDLICNQGNVNKTTVKKPSVGRMLSKWVA